MSEKNKIIVSAIVTIAVIMWLVFMVSCASVPDYGHVPGCLATDNVTLTNHELDIIKRNAFTDGYDVRGGMEKNEK